METVKINWQKDLQLEEIDAHGFIANIDNKFNANYLKWSPDNQFLVLNLMEKLLIFETNIHRLNNERRNLLNDTVGQRLGFRSINIKPNSEFQYKITSNEFCHLPPVIEPRFIDFKFAPSSTFNRYQILACLNDHNVLIIYLNLSSIDWRQICNVNRLTNESLLKRSSDNGDDDYFDRLNKIRISAFEWHPDIDNDTQNETIHRYLYFATKDGHLYSVRLIINRETDCQMRILKKIQTKSEIVTIESLKSTILLIQYRDGRIDLYSGNLEQTTTLWSKRDYRIGLNFARKQLRNDEIEIVFSKYDSIIIANVDANTMYLQSLKEISIKQLNDESMEFHYENIFAIFNLNTYYCLTTMNNDIYSFELAQIDSTLVMRKLIHSSMIKHSDDVHYASTSSSSNNALVAILCRQNRFSGKCTNFKAKNVHLYITTTHTTNPSSIILSLTKRLFSIHHHSFNLADILYMIRYNLLRSDSSQDGFNLIVDILLRKVPIWLERSDGNNDDLNVWSYQIKCIRYLARYCLIDGEKFLLYGDDKQINLERLEKLIDILNLLIMKSHFKHLSFYLKKIIASKNPFYEQLSTEQRISLVNLINADVVDLIPDEIVKQIFKSVEKISQNCPSCENIVKNPASCYLDQCSSKQNCHGHQFDVDCNSLIILNPIEHSIESCLKCYESKLFIRDDRTSLWPEPQMHPFRFASKCCLFCI
ncbi:hypothetical protein BLA29_000920 [Euroglyphus maynei]|uniref:Transcription factor IIIC 90kDa subunit N-terminal domain-containing protein n=1 Tax=Euroglyphus maynei TaxID=6958 RepID=A0A1Y3ATI8_EURMA|nr:hypothetical protein BLA29_000920 [Euroglyphus maynei]